MLVAPSPPVVLIVVAPFTSKTPLTVVAPLIVVMAVTVTLSSVELLPRFVLPRTVEFPVTVELPVIEASPATERPPFVVTVFPAPGLIAMLPERVKPVSAIVRSAAAPVFTVTRSVASPLPRFVAPFRFDVPATVRLLLAVMLPVTSTFEPRSVRAAPVFPMEVGAVFVVLIVVVPFTSTVEPVRASALPTLPIDVAPKPGKVFMLVVPSMTFRPVADARIETPLAVPPLTVNGVCAPPLAVTVRFDASTLTKRFVRNGTSVADSPPRRYCPAANETP